MLHRLGLADPLILYSASPMKWFKKSLKVRADAALSAASTIDGEAQALSRIKNMCSVATASAESAALDPHSDLSKGEKQRFESAKRMSLQLAKEITDVSYRDAALERIVELCMKANDLETARILIKGIQTGMIRERLLEEYPVAFY
jgi:hypothetical protein